MLQMLWVLSSFPPLFDLAVRRPHVSFPVLPAVAPVLPSCLLLVDFDALPEATALGAQFPNPVLTTFRGCEFVID